MSNSNQSHIPENLHVLPYSVFGLLAALSVFWGFNWPVMKVVLTEMAPLHFRSWCLGLSAIGMFALARYSGLNIRVPRNEWRPLVVISVFNQVAWNILAVHSIEMMDSGRAAILGYTMPIWGMLLGFWLLKEPVTRRKLVGLVLGVGGILLLLAGEFTVVGRSPVAALMMILAAMSWAVGLVMIKRWPIGLPLLSYSAWQMAIAFVPIWLGAVLIEPGSFSLLSLSFWPLSGVIYNVLIAFIFCNWAWMKIVTIAPMSVTSLSTLMIPVVGVFSGMLVLGERPGWNDYLALLLVISALVTVLIPLRSHERSVVK